MTEALSHPPLSDSKPILSLQVRNEADIVIARQRARQLGTFLGLTGPDQVGLATAVSEIVRNAVLYVGEARVEFELDLAARPQFLGVRVTDKGPGIPDLQSVLAGQFQSKTGLGAGLLGARRLTERFEIASSHSGTRVSFGKSLPNHVEPLGMGDLGRLTMQLSQPPKSDLRDVLREQNRDLIETLGTLRSRETELQARSLEFERLNLELEETNRGVVALYAELEERAGALRRADQLKSQFLSYVSHEFRTPVNSVMALTHLLLRRTDGELTSEQEKQVIFIRQAVDGLAEMVNDLLDLAKVESGKTEVRTSAVDVGQTLGSVRALMRPLAMNDAVTLIFEDCAPGLVIETDETKLGQILRNLVSNALKFTDRGEVRVRASVTEDGLICFLVEDTGIGIDPQDLDVIFQEFSQVHSPMQGRVKGTGLGLPLSRKLAELLGGTLNVSSQPGQGSTFTLTLPIRTNGTHFVDGFPCGDAESRGGTILIVDDEEASRYVCRQMFRGAPYRLIESEGREAAERARFEKPDLIILDLVMPGRTGFDVLDELSGDAATRDIPVVIHTSKKITAADTARLSGRHRGMLLKSGENRREAFEIIRTALGDPALFAGEPEFATENPSEE